MTSQPDQIDESAGPILVELEVLKGPFAAEEIIASISMRVLGTTKPEALEGVLRTLISGLAVILPDTSLRKEVKRDDFRLILSIGGYWAEVRIGARRLFAPDFTTRAAVLLELDHMITKAARFYKLTGSWYPGPALLLFAKPPMQ